MDCPKIILEPGTLVRTHVALTAPGPAWMINPKHLDQRRANTVGMIYGVVSGHGGDIYWVRHDGDDVLAVYCWNEFELTS